MRSLVSFLLLLATASSAIAQGGAPATLSLEDALALAVRNNPAYLQSLSGRDRAGTALRSAYGTLLPRASTSLSTGYRQGKPEFFSGVSFGANSDVLSSSWGLSFNYAISYGAIAALRTFRSQVDAADEDVTGASQTLRANVTQQYILALQTRARAALQDSLLLSTQLQLDLARAKAGVGSATSLDVKRAEVAVGQQQVVALRAHNTAEVALLQLFQQIGVPMPQAVTLTSVFPVDEPKLDLNELLALAKQGNPALRALKSREQAADASVRAARSLYSPTLSMNASLGGITQKYKDSEYLVNQGRASALASQGRCFSEDSLRTGAGLPSIAGTCSAIVFTDAQAAALRASNNVWPFSFTSSPYNLSLSLSLPLFDGFVREQRVQDAATNRSDARFNVRAQELRLSTDVTAAHRTLVADYRTVRQQEVNAQRALEALQLAQERYRVGLNSLVDLQAARADYQQAETDRIDAIYEFQRAYAALESAVGRALR